MRLFSRLFTAIFVASLVVPAAIAGPALAAGEDLVFPGAPFANAVAGADTVITVEVDNATVMDTGYAGVVTLDTGNGSDTYTADHTYGAPESGTYDFHVTFGDAGGRTLTATDDQGNTLATDSITVIPGPADAATTTITAAPTSLTTDATSTITVQLKDVAGNDLTTSSGTVVLAASNNGAIANLANNGDGTWTADLTDTTVELTVVSGTLDATGIADDATVTFTHGAANKVVFTTQPGDGTGGSALSTQPVVEVEDAGGNLVPGVRTVSVAIDNNAGPGGTLSGTTSMSTNSSGVATFSGLSIDLPGVGYTLDAASSGLLGDTSAAFDITVGGADHLVFTTQPGGAVGGEDFGAQPVVEVRDAGNNVVAVAGRNITVAIGTNPSSGILGGTLTVATDSSGVATFTDLQIDKAGNGYTLSATSAGGVNGASATFNVATGTADHLVFTNTPAGTGGVVFSTQPHVQVVDLGGNPVNSALSITVAIGTNPSGGVLSGANPVSANGSGLATFTNLKINTAGVGYTLTATAVGVTGATSAAFDITVGPATHLVFTTQPAGTTGGIALVSQPVVEVRDAGENLVPVAQGMTIAFGNNAGGGTLGGTTSITTTSGGVGTFSDLSVDKAGTGYTLTASIAGPISGTSATFDVAIGAATHLTLTAGSATSTGGTPFAVAPVVELRDAGDNRVPDAGTQITLDFDIASITGGTLSGTTTVATDVTGTAAFPGVSIDKAGTGYRLIATSLGLTPDRTGPIDITVGPAAAIVFGNPPIQAVQGIAMTPAITVQFVDLGGNLVTTETSLVTLAILSNPSGGTLGGNAATNAVGGVATFSDISINLAGVGYTLTATSGVLPVLTSSTFNIALQPNNAPAGLDAAVQTNEDTAYVFSTSDFGFSDNLDLPPNALSGVKITTLPVAGTLTNNGASFAAGASIPVADITGGLLRFTPALNANGGGYASFTFQVQDNGGTGSGGSDLDPSPNSIVISVVPVDDAPVAVNDGVLVKQDRALTTTFATGVLVNDSDIESPTTSLTAGLVAAPQHGAVTLNSNGSYTYTPAASYLGPDSFTYQASDGTLQSNVATVSITVYINHPPIAASDIKSVISGSPATVLDVLFNDYQINPDPGETLLITAVGHPAHGTAAIVGGGTALSYHPSSTFVGTDIFTYTVSDGQFSTSTSVLVHVPKDKIKPTTTAPVQTIGGQTVGAKSVVVHLAWTGADVGSGVAKYQLQQKKNSGSYATVKLSSARARSVNRTLTVGASYQFRVRAVDKRGNTGAWTYGPKFKVVLAQETSAAFAGAWASRKGTAYSGKKERSTAVAGASATFVTTGRTIAWFGVRGKTRGTAQVFVDGVLAANVNLHQTSTKYRYVAFSRTFATSAVHMVQIVFTDVPTRMIDVDGFVVLR